MSSLRALCRVRPKSPPLQPPSATAIESNARDANERRSDRLIQIGQHAGNMRIILSAAPATAAGGRTFFRPPAPVGLIGFAFDPDHWKDQNGPFE